MSSNKPADIFRKNISEWNTQLDLKGLESFHFNRAKKSGLRSIVIVGIGGSGLAGEVLKSVARDVGLRVPVTLWKDYGVPEENEYERKNPLYIFVSFSGNTEETLSGLRMLLKNKKYNGRLAAVTSGGELEALARRHKVPLIRFSAGTLTPRQSTGNMFYSLIKVLQNAGFKLRVPTFSAMHANRWAAKGKVLARAFRGTIPLFYTNNAYKVIGYIWKIKCNETAKIPAFSNVLPEMNHNEIVGFETRSLRATALFFEDNAAHPRTKKRFALTAHILKKYGVRSYAMPLVGKTKLEKIWNALILADWTSYSMAIAHRTNPAQTKIVDTLKKLMR